MARRTIYVDDTQITDGRPYRTDDSGVFTLKAGQYAKFENMDPTGSGFNYSYSDVDGGGTIYRVDETPANEQLYNGGSCRRKYPDIYTPVDQVYLRLQMTENRLDLRWNYQRTDLYEHLSQFTGL